MVRRARRAQRHLRGRCILPLVAISQIVAGPPDLSAAVAETALQERHYPHLPAGSRAPPRNSHFAGKNQNVPRQMPQNGGYDNNYQRRKVATSSGDDLRNERSPNSRPLPHGDRSKIQLNQNQRGNQAYSNGNRPSGSANMNNNRNKFYHGNVARDPRQQSPPNNRDAEPATAYATQRNQPDSRFNRFEGSASDVDASYLPDNVNADVRNTNRMYGDGVAEQEINNIGMVMEEPRLSHDTPSSYIQGNYAGEGLGGEFDNRNLNYGANGQSNGRTGGSWGRGYNNDANNQNTPSNQNPISQNRNANNVIPRPAHRTSRTNEFSVESLLEAGEDGEEIPRYRPPGVNTNNNFNGLQLSDGEGGGGYNNYNSDGNPSGDGSSHQSEDSDLPDDDITRFFEDDEAWNGGKASWDNAFGMVEPNSLAEMEMRGQIDLGDEDDSFQSLYSYCYSRNNGKVAMKSHIDDTNSETEESESRNDDKHKDITGVHSDESGKTVGEAVVDKIEKGVQDGELDYLEVGGKQTSAQTAKHSSKHSSSSKSKTRMKDPLDAICFKGHSRKDKEGTTVEEIGWVSHVKDPIMCRPMYKPGGSGGEGASGALLQLDTGISSTLSGRGANNYRLGGEGNTNTNSGNGGENSNSYHNGGSSWGGSTASSTNSADENALTLLEEDARSGRSQGRATRYGNDNESKDGGGGAQGEDGCDPPDVCGGGEPAYYYRLQKTDTLPWLFTEDDFRSCKREEEIVLWSITI
jgi:hypothetical protein